MNMTPNSKNDFHENYSFSGNQKRKNDKMNFPIDGLIKSSKVRVVDENGGVTIMTRDDAINEAKNRSMNLVQIAFNKELYPGSICKIFDYAKFKYDQKKKQKEQNRKARAARADLKELSFTIRIDDGDRKTKIKHAKEFLAEGDNVKLSIFMTKREMMRLDFAKTLLTEILNEFTNVKLDKPPHLDGRNWTCIVSNASPIKK